MHKSKQIIKQLLGQRVPGKYLKIRKSDVFLTEYPKSGITWLSFLIANLTNDNEIDFTNIKQKIVPIYAYSRKELEKIKGQRYLKSHEPFSQSYPTVIYLIRDPRDVVISYYHYFKKYRTDFNTGINEFIINFISGEVGPYGSYNNHVNGWLNNSADKKIIYVKYEDLKNDTFNQLQKICNFLSVKVSEERINQAIELSSFDKMKELEEKNKDHEFFFKNSNKGLNFVRKGSSEEWKKIFSEEQKKIFKKHMGKLLIDLGYEKNLDW